MQAMSTFIAVFLALVQFCIIGRFVKVLQCFNFCSLCKEFVVVTQCFKFCSLCKEFVVVTQCFKILFFLQGIQRARLLQRPRRRWQRFVPIDFVSRIAVAIVGRPRRKVRRPRNVAQVQEERAHRQRL